MKFSAVLSLGIAPVALAKSVHNVYPVRRDPAKAAPRGNQRGGGTELGNIGVDPAVIAQTGLILGELQEVVVIWVNPGNSAATTTLNAQSTVTQTVTVNGQGSGSQGSTGAGQTLAPLGGSSVAGAASSVVSGATGAQQTHAVTLGGPKGLTFEPNTITANVGDMVIFTFLSANHTATQSAFATPCEPLAGGMDSGFQPNANNSVNPPPQVAMQVMVTTPVWFYCRQTGHCGKGMTFSINPTAAKTQAMFQQMAIAQNGTGSGSAITGNGGASSSSVSVAGSGSLTATLGGAAGSTATASLPAGTAGGIATGTGTLDGTGACQCAAVCGAGSFPAVQAQGIGGFGGMPGALPQSMVAAR